MLASLDGAIGPAADARIPVTDEGLLRGDGAFEVVRLYGGRPYAMEEHYARLGRTCAGLRLAFDLAALRARSTRCSRRPARSTALLRLVVTRGGRRIAHPRAAARTAPAVARVTTVTYAPTRVLDGLKTLSYAGNMLATRLAQERGFDEALLVTPHGRVLEGADVDVLLGRGRRAATRRRSRTGSSTRSRAGGSSRSARHRGALHARRPRGRRGGRSSPRPCAR